jgi:hypothetical protein
MVSDDPKFLIFGTKKTHAFQVHLRSSKTPKCYYFVFCCLAKIGRKAALHLGSVFKYGTK